MKLNKYFATPGIIRLWTDHENVQILNVSRHLIDNVLRRNINSAGSKYVDRCTLVEYY